MQLLLRVDFSSKFRRLFNSTPQHKDLRLPSVTSELNILQYAPFQYPAPTAHAEQRTKY
jgi:hypothetical protein